KDHPRASPWAGNIPRVQFDAVAADDRDRLVLQPVVGRRPAPRCPRRPEDVPCEPCAQRRIAGRSPGAAKECAGAPSSAAAGGSVVAGHERYLDGVEAGASKALVTP